MVGAELALHVPRHLRTVADANAAHLLVYYGIAQIVAQCALLFEERLYFVQAAFGECRFIICAELICCCIILKIRSVIALAPISKELTQAGVDTRRTAVLVHTGLLGICPCGLILSIQRVLVGHDEVIDHDVGILDEVGQEEGLDGGAAILIGGAQGVARRVFGVQTCIGNRVHTLVAGGAELEVDQL